MCREVHTDLNVTESQSPAGGAGGHRLHEDIQAAGTTHTLLHTVTHCYTHSYTLTLGVCPLVSPC